jgi:preprotein translocase subunit SecD
MMFMTHTRSWRILFFITILTVIATYIALPPIIPIHISLGGSRIDRDIVVPPIQATIFGRTFSKEFVLKQGLDIQGGMQVVLRADMSEIAEEDKKTALESARDVILRRVDLFGISEPVVQTAQVGEERRILVDLPGVDDPNQALQLVGATAQLDFRLQSTDSASIAEATQSAVAFFGQFQPTGLTGKQLKRAIVQFDQQTGEPVISLEFDDEGRQLFADITKEHVSETLAIFLDDFPVMMPTINTPILDGKAIITGGFSLEEAKQLAIQLNAGALPIPIEVIEQRQLGASLGQEAVSKSVKAGLIGIGLVMLFMVLVYGWKGLLADWALIVYGILTIALYKILGVTLTLPGIAGLLLSIGMAVDANILIFERMKEELRLGKPFARAMELGFGRAWDSIKDANIATILTAVILINPLNLGFLNSSGLVRGFGITLLVGVLIGLFTGIVVTRTLLRLFLSETGDKQ